VAYNAELCGMDPGMPDAPASFLVDECDHPEDKLIWPTGCGLWPEKVGTRLGAPCAGASATPHHTPPLPSVYTHREWYFSVAVSARSPLTLVRLRLPVLVASAQLASLPPTRPIHTICISETRRSSLVPWYVCPAQVPIARRQWRARAGVRISRAATRRAAVRTEPCARRTENTAGGVA
jgi:hypothetical protein